MFSASKTAAPSGYNLQRSVRLRSSASAYLTRTPTVAGNRQKFTWSGWIKRGNFGAAITLFEGFISGGFNGTYIWFRSDDTLQFYDLVSSTQMELTTSAVFRDPAAWYHIVVSCDTTQATAANRAAIYVNGVQQTLATATYPSQNYQFGINNTTAQYIGANNTANTGLRSYYDGEMTEINFVDGQQLTPSSFGAYNSFGVWSPAKYSGSYGTNGFYLNFQDNSAATAAAIGKDSSGNGNNWTPNNISVTAGVTYDSMTDVPTNTSATNANFAVMNPIVPTGASVISGGNLNIVGVATYCNGLSTISLDSGAYYSECVVNTHVVEGWGVWDITKSAAANTGTAPSGFYGIYSGGATLMSNGTVVTTNAAGTPANGDILQVAWNNGKVWLGKNNTWYDSSFGTTGNPSAGTNATFTGLTVSQFAFIFGIGNGATSLSANFGQRPFTYTPPTGFVALNTFNLPAPTVPNGALYMAATTYTGVDGVAGTVTGTQFQPDFVWGKTRAIVNNNGLFDSVRGVQKFLASDSTAAEVTSATYLTAFNSNGFSYGTSSLLSGGSMVAWQWKAGGTAVTNTSGTISSQVSANPSAGFSIVTYTGTGSAATVGHSLGVAPRMIMVKYRNVLTSNDWNVYHASLGATQRLYLNLTNAAQTSSLPWNNTTPTSTVFSIGTGSDVNNSATNYVAYCFAEIAGYSKFGSYTGNGSSNGPFIYTGFRPRWIMIKYSSGVDNWAIFDTARLGYNADNNELLANTTGAEGTTDFIDILSNGFKNRNSDARCNGSGATYIYAAFAENPFNYSLAR
jgi:hypothetical protein